jgi:hypothetical protein
MPWKKKPKDYLEITLDINDGEINFRSKNEKKIILEILKKNSLNELKSLTESIQFMNTRQLVEKKRLDDLINQQDEILNKQDEILNSIKSKIKKENSKYECNICFENEIEYVCVPCGHTFCSKCLNGNECYICRSPIQSKVKLYF